MANGEGLGLYFYSPLAIRHSLSRQFLLSKELPQLTISFLWRFLGEIMSARQRLGAADVAGVALPDLARARSGVAADAAGRAPQQQHRAGDLAPGFEVFGVHVEIDAGAGAIILAHGMHRRRIAEIALVLGECRRIEEAQALFGLRQLLLDEEIRI